MVKSSRQPIYRVALRPAYGQDAQNRRLGYYGGHNDGASGRRDRTSCLDTTAVSMRLALDDEERRLALVSDDAAVSSRTTRGLENGHSAVRASIADTGQPDEPR